ncbi:MAG: hypothetical protein NTV55_05295 [Planctomycetota bacterium]|nr:hypothetical protein [Planctomycetota bacterium]
MSDQSGGKGSKAWLGIVAMAGLAWGTYVPVVFYGGKELGGAAGGTEGARLTSILCVGLAYFVLAVLIPLGLFLTKKHAWPPLKPTGLAFSCLAGMMGAVGAICVIFASKAAVNAAKAAGLEAGSYRMLIAPLIFGLAPVINTLVSLVWHPKPGSPWHFGLEKLPGAKLVAGILLVGLGSALVLFSKEQEEKRERERQVVTTSLTREATAAQPEILTPTLAITESAINYPAWEWLVFTGLAGLAWGTYVPIIFYGGQELTTKPGELGGRLLSILCVGMAYFLLAVMVPVGLMGGGVFAWPQINGPSGLLFSSLAGVAGAVGAICVIFASKAAVDAAKAEGKNPATYRIFIAPIIFGVAPVINTMVSLLWHPQAGDPLHFGIRHLPGWILWAGIFAVGSGAFLVLLAKEQGEAAHAPKPGK